MISLSFSRYYSYIAAKKIYGAKYEEADKALEKSLLLNPFKKGIALFSSDIQHIQNLSGKSYLLKAKGMENSPDYINNLKKSVEYYTTRFAGKQKNKEFEEKFKELKAQLTKAKEQKTSPDYFEVLKKAQIHYLQSVKLNPHDIKPAKGLAESTYLLEKAFLDLFPKGENPYNALPYYRNLALIRPNGLTVHYMIARYLHYKDMNGELSDTVAHIAYLYPNDVINGDLKAEDFYSLELKEPIKTGLEKAVALGVNQRAAHFAISRLMEDEKRFAHAVEQYQKGMENRAYLNTARNYIHLGRLHIKNQRADLAFEAFEKGLNRSSDFDGSFKSIYYCFQKEEEYQSFLDFTAQIMGNVEPSTVVSLFIARARMKMGLNELARARLLQVVSKKPDSDAFYLLSVIAEEEGDWDSMELNIQKASVLDPDKCHYYSKFAKSLYKQGKSVQAKIQQSKARECSAVTQN